VQREGVLIDTCDNETRVREFVFSRGRELGWPRLWYGFVNSKGEQVGETVIAVEEGPEAWEAQHKGPIAKIATTGAVLWREVYSKREELPPEGPPPAQTDGNDDGLQPA